MASKIKVDQLETADGTGTIVLQNQLSGMTTASLPTVTTDKLGAGAVLQTISMTSTVSNGSSTTSDASSTSGLVLGIAHITPKKAGSTFIVSCSYGFSYSPTQNHQAVRLWIGTKIGTGNQSAPFNQLEGIFYGYVGNNIIGDDPYEFQTVQYPYAPSYTLGQTISFESRLGANRGSSSVPYPTTTYRHNANTPPSTIIVQEIAG